MKSNSRYLRDVEKTTQRINILEQQESKYLAAFHKEGTARKQCQEHASSLEQDLSAIQNKREICQGDVTKCQSEQTQASKHASSLEQDLSAIQNKWATCQDDVTKCQLEKIQLDRELRDIRFQSKRTYVNTTLIVQDMWWFASNRTLAFSYICRDGLERLRSMESMCADGYHLVSQHVNKGRKWLKSFWRHYVAPITKHNGKSQFWKSFGRPLYSKICDWTKSVHLTLSSALELISTTLLDYFELVQDEPLYPLILLWRLFKWN